MELFECIEKRHSYRDDYTEAPVPREDLKKIVEAGIMAPSGANAQTTTFVIVDDPQIIKKMSGIIPKTFVEQSKALIVCSADPKGVYKGMSFQKEDCAAAVENMLLAVTALGYATVWLDGFLRIEERQKKISELLGIPENLEVRVVLPIGVPVKQWQQKEKLSFEDRAWFNNYGNQGK